MPYTKKQLAELEGIRGNLRRAAAYLEKSSGIAFAMEENKINGGDYKLINPECAKSCINLPVYVRSLNPHIGSDIAGLYTALGQIEALLNPPKPFFDETFK